MVWLGFAGSSPPPADPAPDEQDQVEPSSGDSDIIFNVLPWLISLMLHAGVILLALFIVWSVQEQVEEEEIIIPIARLSATPRPPLQQTEITKNLRQTSTTRTRRSLVRKSRVVAQTELSKKVDSSGLSLKPPELSKTTPFDTGVRTGEGLEARFYGTGGNARRLAYLVDASGSLIDTLPFVILELKRSIGELSEQQSFTVVFFQGEDAIEVPPYGLKRATAENKAKVIKWVDPSAGNVTPMGLSNPVKALRLALRYKPQLLFILSDNITGQGRYEVDQRRLLEDIQRENKGQTKINTIQFLYPDPLEAFGMTPTLQLISERTGGIYKFIDGRELGIQ